MKMYKKSIITFILFCTIYGCKEKSNPVVTNSTLYSSISGFVYDKATSKPLPRARVIVIDQKETFSDSTGYFYLDSLTVGQIILSIEKDFYHHDTMHISLKIPDTLFKLILLEPLKIVSYRVLATVTEINGTPTIDVSIDDKISGYISYKIESQDILISDASVGYYPQMDKACKAEFRINNISFRNSLNQDTLFYVAVQNDYVNHFFFQFYDELYFGPFIDYQLRDSLLLNELRLVISLQDNSSEVFSDDKLPREIEFERFNFRVLFIAARTNDSAWSIWAEIDKFDFEMPNESASHRIAQRVKTKPLGA